MFLLNRLQFKWSTKGNYFMIILYHISPYFESCIIKRFLIYSCKHESYNAGEIEDDILAKFSSNIWLPTNCLFSLWLTWLEIKSAWHAYFGSWASSWWVALLVLRWSGVLIILLCSAGSWSGISSLLSIPSFRSIALVLLLACLQE